MPRNSTIFFFLLLASCSSTIKRNQLDIHDFEVIQVGDRTDKVTSTLGRPAEIRANDDGESSDSWIYDDKNGSQRGTIGVNKRNSTVDTILIIPTESEPEYRLDYLLKSKFSSGTFEKISRQRCHRDYFPSEDYYIDVRQGLVIEANRRTGEVGSFHRTTSQSAADLLKQVRECKR